MIEHTIFSHWLSLIIVMFFSGLGGFCLSFFVKEIRMTKTPEEYYNK